MGEISVLLCADAPSTIDVVDEILQLHGCSSDGDGETHEFTIEVDTGNLPIDIPASADEVAIHESGLQVLWHENRRFLRRGDASAEIDLSRSVVRASLPAFGRIAEKVHIQNLLLIITFSLIILLQHRGRYALHAAALCYHGDEGFLIVAAGDSGKSTMTMHLVREGWAYISDDSVLVSSSNGIVEATPLRRDFALDPDAVELFPEIRSHSIPLFTDPVKRRVQPDRIFPQMRLERCVPRILIFPELVGAGTSRLQPVDGRDAFVRLMQQASFLTQDPAAAAKQIQVLKDLVGQSRAYRLEAANDIKRDGSRVSELLARLIT